MIHVHFTGNIGKNAVIRDTNGRRAISFSVAINESYKDANGNKVDKTLWAECTMWKEPGQSTELAKYLTSGVKVGIHGIPSVQAYRTKEGAPGASLKVTVRDLELLSSKKEDGNGEVSATAAGQTDRVDPMFDTAENMNVPVAEAGAASSDEGFPY